MRLLLRIFYCLMAIGLTGCNDFLDRHLHDLHNRTYRYQEQVPLKPFVFKLVKTEYGNVDGKTQLKLFLKVIHRSAQEDSLSKSRFALRVGPSQELERDPALLEALGIDTVSFAPTEEAIVTIPFTLSNESLREKLSLIVERREKKGRVYLTLIEVKEKGVPKNPPEPGQWRTAHSPRWE